MLLSSSTWACSISVCVQDACVRVWARACVFVPVSFTALFTALSVFPVRSDGRKSARGRSDNSVLIKLFACKIISLSHPSHHHDLTLSGDKPPFGLSTLSRCPPPAPHTHPSAPSSNSPFPSTPFHLFLQSAHPPPSLFRHHPSFLPSSLHCAGLGLVEGEGSSCGGKKTLNWRHNGIPSCQISMLMKLLWLDRTGWKEDAGGVDFCFQSLSLTDARTHAHKHFLSFPPPS